MRRSAQYCADSSTHSIKMFRLELALCLISSSWLAVGLHHLPAAEPVGTDRAIGVLTAGDYWKTFTKGNQDLLKSYNLLNKRMVKDETVSPSSETIKWTQVARCLLGCKEEYLLVDYYQDGDKNNPVMKVFVARELGSPPQEFSTAGYEGKLHFGYLNFGGQHQAIYFVLQPADWFPFQHRFKTNSFTKFFNDGIAKAASAAGGAAAGWAAGAAIGSIVPGAGTVVGGVIGVAIGSFTDDLFGDYLRYIG